MPADLLYMSVTVYNYFLTAYMSLKLNNYQLYCVFVVCLFIVPLENFSLTWRRHHYL